jgi:hypothetical protein
MRHRYHLPLKLCLLLTLAACDPDTRSGDPPSTSKVGDHLPVKGNAQTAPSHHETSWDELIPPSWDAAEIFAGLDLDALQDTDPRAEAVLEKMRRAWDDAPANPEMQGRAIRIPGFVVPLDADGGALREFLLVPYFGGCIHVPPPPANQIIHVFAQPPLENVQTMDAIWVSGTLSVVRSNSQMGSAGYQMTAQKVEPYQWDKNP